MDWELFLYRLPSEPSRVRVGVWRELRKLGALPLAQTVVAVPVAKRFKSMLDAVEARVERDGGSSYRFPLVLTAEQQTRLQAEWNALREHEYAEIIEECETKFLKEIEFELFRGNLTGSEAEEIEADLDKIKRWMERVRERDLFKANGSEAARAAIAACQSAFDDFVDRVYQAEENQGPILDTPEDIPWGDMPPQGPDEVVELRPGTAPRIGPRRKKTGRKSA